MSASKVTITTTAGETSAAEISAKVLRSDERYLRSVKALAFSWIAAGVSIAIPVMHFVLVPLFLILGPILAFLAFKKTHSLAEAKLLCPHCKTKFTLKPAAVEWPLKDVCPKCRTQLKIEAN